MDPMSIIHFAKSRVNTRWNKFNFEKICDIAYANIQGKSCLIEKFRNSNVMDQNPDYRPLLFKSFGSDRGKQQPFPEPNNMGRKMRSVANAQQIGKAWLV